MICPGLIHDSLTLSLLRVTKVKFFLLCDVISLARLQAGKFVMTRRGARGLDERNVIPVHPFLSFTGNQIK